MDPKIAAMAYALWDSENTTRMNPDQFDHYADQAREVIRWLDVHGMKIEPKT